MDKETQIDFRDTSIIDPSARRNIKKLEKNQIKGGIFVLRRTSAALNGRQCTSKHYPQVRGALQCSISRQSLHWCQRGHPRGLQAQFS